LSDLDQTLGVWLRETREARGSSVEDAAAATRIRPRFIAMMEAGNFSSFPGGELQIRGFLRVISRYLNLPADDVLARYDAEVRGIEADAESDEQATVPAAESPEPSQVAWRPLALSLSPSAWRRGSLASGLIWAAIVVVVIGASASLAYVLIQGRDGREAADAAIPTAVPTQMAAAPTQAPQPTPTTVPDLPKGVTVSLEPVEHVWVRVTVDGRIAHVGFLVPQETKTWSGDEEVLVETGNGAGLEATVNDRPVGRLGSRGAVVRRSWAPTGEIEPA
jgi:cytoskeletal protein RodZ